MTLVKQKGKPGLALWNLHMKLEPRICTLDYGREIFWCFSYDFCIIQNDFTEWSVLVWLHNKTNSFSPGARGRSRPSRLFKLLQGQIRADSGQHTDIWPILDWLSLPASQNQQILEIIIPTPRPSKFSLSSQPYSSAAMAAMHQLNPPPFERA